MNDLPIRLTEAEWNVVLQALGQAPYSVVAAIIQRIQAQAQVARLPEHPDTGRANSADALDADFLAEKLAH